jgi:hypothetical protein
MTQFSSVEHYAKKMLSEGAWAGGIELVCFSRARQVNVHVYRVGLWYVVNRAALTLLLCKMCSFGRGFYRISVFNINDAVRTISLVFWGGNHYDYLHLRDGHGNLTY